jgi:hypothetical protein
MIVNCKPKFFAKFLFLSLILLVGAVVWCAVHEKDAAAIGIKKKTPCAEKVQVQQKTIINRLEKIENRFIIQSRN